MGDQFPDLLKCAKDKDAKVKSYMTRSGDQVVWSPYFKEELEGPTNLAPKPSQRDAHPRKRGGH